MKSFVSLALTLVLTAACLVGCGCTNRNMENTSAPTVLPTNEEIWNSTETTMESTTGNTTQSTTAPGTTGGTMDESTEETKGINETEVHNYVNAQQDLNEKIRENQNRSKSSNGNGEGVTGRMMPGGSR